MRKGLLLALINVGLVLTIGVKQSCDRSSLPRAWARVSLDQPGEQWSERYLQLRIEAHPESAFRKGWQYVKLNIEDGRLVARRSAQGTGVRVRLEQKGRPEIIALTEAVDFYVPEGAADPA